MTAVMVKEWRRLVRSSSTPWALLVYLLAPVAIAAVYLKASSSAPMGMQAQQLPLLGAQALTNVATWQLLLLAAATPWISASLLAAEVEDRTLDPVLAGRGSLGAVVAGKLLAVLFFMWLLIVAGLPAFALPMLVGGINYSLLLRVIGLEAATVAMMAGLGLALSAFGRRSGSVALVGVALGLVLTLGTGMAGGLQPAAGNVYNRPELMVKMAMAGGAPGLGTVPKWLYANPLVGLNDAIPNPQASMGMPVMSIGPVFKQYRLWQVQLVGSGAVVLLSWLAAWATMAVRLRWRRPRWAVRKAHKAVTVDG